MNKNLNTITFPYFKITQMRKPRWIVSQFENENENKLQKHNVFYLLFEHWVHLLHERQ